MSHLDRVLTGNGVQSTPFELVVLETALSHVTAKMKKHQALITPLLDVLVNDTLSADPPNQTVLRRNLAFKHNLSNFEKDVIAFKSSLESLLGNDEDMADLFLSSKDMWWCARDM